MYKRNRYWTSRHNVCILHFVFNFARALFSYQLIFIHSFMFHWISYIIFIHIFSHTRILCIHIYIYCSSMGYPKENGFSATNENELDSWQHQISRIEYSNYCFSSSWQSCKAIAHVFAPIYFTIQIRRAHNVIGLIIWCGACNLSSDREREKERAQSTPPSLGHTIFIFIFDVYFTW